MPRDDGLGRGTGERWLARQRLVQYTRETVDVAAAIDLPGSSGLFGRHVGRGADHQSRLGEFVPARGADRARDAEIGHDRMTTGQHDVLGLDVAMHDVMAVRVRQRVGDLARDLQRVVERELRLPLQPLA